MEGANFSFFYFGYTHFVVIEKLLGWISMSEKLPQKYKDLIRNTYLLNRVHNSDDMAVAVSRFKTFAEENLCGRVEIHSYKPGEIYNHWIIPRRWNVIQFEVIGPNGQVIAEISDHPLVVCPYSCSIDIRLSKQEFLKKVITDPGRPQHYPFYFQRMYRHWEEDWNLSLPYNTIVDLPDGEYHVQLIVEFTDDPMLVFEYILDGKTDKTIYMAGHLDHPGLINDSLSGCIACLQIMEAMERNQTEYTYRVWILPEIIGSAVHLKANEWLLETANFAFCPNMTAHPAPLAMCLSKAENSLLDLALIQALKEKADEHVIGQFQKYADCGDEISFNTVGYDIPASTLSRIGEQFVDYHMSSDNLDNFFLEDWQQRHTAFVNVSTIAFHYLESNRVIKPLFRGNPCLSNPDIDLYLTAGNVNNKRNEAGLGSDLDGKEIDLRKYMEFFLDALSKPDITTLEIANASRMPFDFVNEYAQKFAAKNLVQLLPVSKRLCIEQVATTALDTANLLKP